MNTLFRGLEHLEQSLNAYFLVLDPRRIGPAVVLSDISTKVQNSDGPEFNRIVMSIYNTAARYDDVVLDDQLATPIQSSPIQPESFEVMSLIFMANFTDVDYRAGLEFLLQLVSYFDQNPTLTYDLTDGSSPTTATLRADRVNHGVAEISNIMGAMGARYLPSVFYEIRQEMSEFIVAGLPA